MLCGNLDLWLTNFTSAIFVPQIIHRSYAISSNGGPGGCRVRQRTTLQLRDLYPQLCDLCRNAFHSRRPLLRYSI